MYVEKSNEAVIDNYVQEKAAFKLVLWQKKTRSMAKKIVSLGYTLIISRAKNNMNNL